MYRADGDQAGEPRGLLSCDYTLPGFQTLSQTKISHQVMKGPVCGPEASFASWLDSNKGGQEDT